MFRTLRELGDAMTTATTAGGLTPAQNWYLIAITAGSLLVCFVFTVARARTFGIPIGRKARVRAPGAQVTLRSRMGQGQWDFSQSFATNIAVIGSVLSLILNTSEISPTPVLGSTGILPGGAYAGLGIFFGTLVTIAPLLYNGTAKRVTVASPGDRDTSAEYHGTVRGFLLAAVVTQWGLLGSVVTVFLTLLELEHAGSLSLTPVILLAIALLAAMYCFARYSWVKIGGTLADQFDPAAAGPGGPAAARETPAVVTAPRPRWTLL
jgi:hypothetical protein